MNEETKERTLARYITVRREPVWGSPFIWKQWTGNPPAWERYRTEGPSEIWSDGTTFTTKGISINSIRSKK